MKKLIDIGAEIERVHEHNILFLVVSKFAELPLGDLDNEEMGKLFEHLVRKFNEHKIDVE